MSEARWVVRANKHPNLDGTRWGRIEPTDICWSNNQGSELTEEGARRLADEHNATLEQESK